MKAKFMNRKGMALIIIFFAVTVLIIFSIAFVSVNISQKNTVEIFQRREQAFNLAEAGLDHALYWLKNTSFPPIDGEEDIDPWGGVQNMGEGSSYSVKIKDEPGIVGRNRYKITSTGSFKNTNRILTNYVQTENFTDYIWFTNKETHGVNTVWFFSQDHLRGPTQTNQHFNIMGNPVFEDEVRSVDNYIRFYNDGHNINLSQLTNPPYDIPDFQQGVDFGVSLAETINTPSERSKLLEAKMDQASSGGILLDGDTTVVLNNDGTMNVTNLSNSWINYNMPLPVNGVLYINAGNLTISGTLNGRLTATASLDIIIPNNLIYASDPRINPGSTDVLSVISGKDVVISASAPTDLEIDGCVMALNSSFLREDYWVGPPKGTLTIYGSIVQNERGPVGTFNGATGVKVSGYSKDYFYDTRLQNNPPPYPPVTHIYRSLSWEEN